jgi:hypothetical protein
MFAVDTIIDSIQSSKKMFVNTFVTDKNTKEALNSFVDSQTEFTKQMWKTSEVVAKESFVQIEKTLKFGK